jgi:two-component system, cell cycle sensor histidine kinase and response regulator CckA
MKEPCDERRGLEAIVGQSADGLIVIDEDGIVRFANPTASKLFEKPVEELVGFHFGAPVVNKTIELTLPGGDDSRIVEMRSCDISWKGGIATLASMRDITDRVRTEQNLRQARDYLRGLYDSVGEGIFSVRMPERVIEHVNPMVERIFGYRGEELIGQPTSLLYPDLQEFKGFGEKLDFAMVEGYDRIETEQTLRRKNGETFSAEVTITFLISDGAVRQVVSVVRDITERKEMEAQLAQADRLSSMGMLAAGVAHEINNPLSYVLINLESMAEDLPELLQPMRIVQTMLSNRPVPAEIPSEVIGQMNPATFDSILERFESALRGTRRIHDIVRGLGTFSRVEKDQLVSVNLRRVIDVAINMAYNEIKYRARLVRDYGKVPPIMASEGPLSQVFLNLLINATHAIDEGNVEGNEIRVRTWAEGVYVFAEVCDTGRGIPKENLGKLFEPFFTTKEIGMGSGLGLAISKSIIESYSGTIKVQSEVGKGTRFTICLPVHLEAREPLVTEAETNLKSAPRGRILIVDDEAEIRIAMARMLRNHDTVQAGSGAEARRLLEHDQSFDLILCDMMMSDVSGMDLHDWLVANYPFLDEQFVFITGGAFTPRAREYLSKIDNIRLEKPFNIPKFKKTVNELVLSTKGLKQR